MSPGRSARSLIDHEMNGELGFHHRELDAAWFPMGEE